MTLGSAEEIRQERGRNKGEMEGKETFSVRQREAQMRRKKKRKTERTLVASTFADLYKLTGETLGEGSYGKVETCVNIFTELEYAVKTIEKKPGFYSRSKVLKEIEIYALSKGQQNIIQLIEYFEEDEKFYLVFEKIHGGPLLDHIQARIYFTEAEASSIIQDLAKAIKFLHSKGIAHRDLKPDNVLCMSQTSPCPVKLCDFDLCSKASIDISTPTLVTPVGSVEYMAPEVVDTFILDDYDEDDDDETYLTYNKKCDLWSLGIIMYILLCGYAPFSGYCDLDCGWDMGESCQECQERLFTNIKEGRLVFPHQHWSNISPGAKNLIENLLIKDSSQRFDADQVLDHKWVTTGGTNISLDTPSNLRRQASIKELEDFASRAMAVNRAVEEEEVRQQEMPTITLRSPWRSETWSHDTSPAKFFVDGSDLFEKRRKSRINLWDKTNKFCSIDEVDFDFNLQLKTIV